MNTKAEAQKVVVHWGLTMKKPKLVSKNETLCAWNEAPAVSVITAGIINMEGRPSSTLQF